MANFFGLGYATLGEAIGLSNWGKGMFWASFRGPRHSLKKMELKLRPRDFKDLGITNLLPPVALHAMYLRTYQYSVCRN